MSSLRSASPADCRPPTADPATGVACTHTPNPCATTSSASPPEIVQGIPCRMVLYFRHNIVGMGQYFIPVLGETIDCSPLQEGNVRVIIQTALKQTAPLPIPSAIYSKVGQVVDIAVPWPREYVIPETEVEVAKSNGNFIQDFRNTVVDAFSDKAGRHIEIEIDEAVFGHTLKLNVDREDILFICDMEWLSATCMLLYCSHIYRVLVRNNIDDVFRFVHEVDINWNKVGATNDQTHVNIAKRIHGRSQGALVFIIVLHEDHWLLIVVDVEQNVAYYWDPLNGQYRTIILDLVNRSIRKLNEMEEINRNNPTWRKIKCPKQPDSTTCGYFVLRYLRDIISDRSGLPLDQFPFIKKSTYSKDEIDAVRIEWIEHIRPHFDEAMIVGAD